MSLHLSRALLLSLPVLGIAALAPRAEAATSRWQDVTFTPTQNDGLALTGATFEGSRVLSSLAVPYFTLNGVRYELTDASRVGVPQTVSTEGMLRVEASYRVSVSGGNVDLVVSHSLSDHDGQYADLGELSSKVRFSGPEGEYAFFWRVDADLRGAAGDRVQVFDGATKRGYWTAPALEQAISLKGNQEFGRFKVMLSDGPDFAHQTQLRLASADNSSAYVVRAHDGEWEQDVRGLVNGEPVQRVSVGELVPQPVQGSDLVLWYKAELKGASGEVGPDMYAATLAGRQAVTEVDRMQSTAYPVNSALLQGEVISFESAFAKAGITINRVIKEGVIADKAKVAMADLDAMMEANVTYQATMDTPTQWFSWFGVAKSLNIQGVLGIMYDVTGYSGDTAYREGAFSLYDSIVSSLPLLEDAGYPPQDLDKYMLWTFAHETGHAYNQHHEDFWIVETSCFYEDTAIMGYSYDLENHLFWDFGPNSNPSMSGGDPEEYVRPGHGVDFISGRLLYPYNTTRTHKRGHHDIEEFSGGGCE